MSFHTYSHHHTLSDPANKNQYNYSATSTILQRGNALGVIGAPSSYRATSKAAASYIPDHNTIPPHPAQGVTTASSNDPLTQSPLTRSRLGSLSWKRRSHHESRDIESGGLEAEIDRQQSGTAMSDVHHYGAPPSYGNDNGQGNHQVPGALQPGLPTRPHMHMNPVNAAQSMPTLPQIQTQMQQPPPPMSARPTMTQSHSYSRSSPSNMDSSKYKPFSNKTPEAPKYVPPPANYVSPPGQGPSSYSPLGLADIRPRADTLLSDTTFSPSQATDTEPVPQYPTNSNYLAPWPIYAVDWCKWSPKGNNASAGKIAMGSYLEDNHNYIQILDAQRTQVDPENPHGERGLDFIKTAEATHSYPVTRILWEPPSSNKQTTDLLATSGDHLRLWSLPTDTTSLLSNTITRPTKDLTVQKLSPLALLSNSKSPEHTAPITSLDWNIVQPSLIITSSIDTTCTIWDIPTLTAKTQLIAHDKEVFDVRFCANSVDVFVSCGADGSVRMFDLRSLEHSTIIYEPSDKQDKSSQLSPDPLSASPTRGGNPHSSPFPPPLLRIAASPHDAHLLATFSQDSNIIRILDVRQPGQALLELKGHGAAVSCIEWSNMQRGLLASGADDCCVMLWDLMGSSVTSPHVAGPQPPGATSTSQERGPSATWECGYEVTNLSWAPVSGTLGVSGGKGFWGVQI